LNFLTEFSVLTTTLDIFGQRGLYVLTGYQIQEHASLAELLETQMHLRYDCEIKQKLTFSANGKASFSGRKLFLCQKKKKSLNV
jgi:hypothetical protein